MQYIIVTQHQIEDLRASMDLFEQLWGEDVDEHSLYLYGMVREDPALTGPMEDSVKEQNDLHQSLKISMATIIIPLSSDILYYLTGSGLILRDEDFAYINDREIRTSSLSWTHQEPRVTLASFTKMALASSDYHAEDFLKWEGTDALEHGDTGQEQSRTEEATKTPKKPEEPQEGGIVEPEGGTVGKSSSMVATEPKVWSTSSLENDSMEELFALRNRLMEDPQVIQPSSKFVWFEASNFSGYLIQAENPQEAFSYIARKMGLDASDIEMEATVMTGRELVDYIESLLGE